MGLQFCYINFTNGPDFVASVKGTVNGIFEIDVRAAMSGPMAPPDIRLYYMIMINEPIPDR